MALQQRILEAMRFVHSAPHRGLMVRSAIIWGLGDVGAQAITHYSAQDKDESISFGKKDKEFKMNWYRVYKASVFGVFAPIGPAAYYRLNTRRWSSITNTAEVVSSAVRDGLWATICLATFIPLMGSAQRRTRSAEQAKEDMKRGFTPALVLGGAVLPAVLITTWRFVPVPYQLHCASLFALVVSCSLSWIELEQHKDVAVGPEDGRSNKVTTAFERASSHVVCSHGSGSSRKKVLFG